MSTPLKKASILSTVPEGEPLPVIRGSNVTLIDGSGFIFRAFHALPPLTRPSDGLPVGAVHGFCAMLWKLLAETKLADRPTHLAVVFDASEKTFRKAISADYKAHRPPPPEELVPQFPLIREAVRAFNIACVEQDGYEADDLIATYARHAAIQGGDVVIVSSDKDLMQLVGPSILMLDTMKNRRIGRDEVIERFGVPPEKVIDVQALAGDSVDNVPGVPGIGVKTAAELIQEYGDLDSLLARAAEIKQPKRREKLIEFAGQARLSRLLVTLKDDVATEVPIEALGVRDPDPETLIGFLRRMEFATLTRRIARALGVEAPPAPEKSVGSTVLNEGTPRVGAERPATEPPGAGTPAAAVAHHAGAAKAVPLDRSKYEIVTTTDGLQDWIAMATGVGRAAMHIALSTFDPMRAEPVGLALAVAPGKACYVPLGHRTGGGGLDFAGAPPEQAPLGEALTLLRPLFENPSVLKVGHDMKPAVLLLARHGVRVAPLDDTMVVSYALDGGKHGQGLIELAERHFGHACVSLDSVLAHAPGAKKGDRKLAEVPVGKAAEFAAETADVALRLWLLLKPRLAAERVTRVYEAIDRPLVAVVAEMERIGVIVDRAVLARLSGQFAQNIARLEEEIFTQAGDRFNLGSPKQMGELLFDRLALPGGKRTRTGQWETRAGTLDDLAANEELPPEARRLINTLLEWRQLTKLKTTYTDSLPDYIHPETGRIHTSFALAHTTTGRVASSEPNLQNIPVRTKEGRAIRTAFIAGPGHKLVSADYSQIELRILAHIADISQLKRAFEDGLDIHALTASEMFGVPVKDMPADVRRRAKAINFGIIYGISAFGLGNQLGIAREEAGQYIKTYFERFPGIRDYMDRTKKLCRDQGFVTTLFGRKVHYPEINTKNPSVRGNLERAAINAPIQGSAADIIRRAMVRMPGALAAAGLGSARMLLQVHDELLFEVADAEVEATLPVVADVMASSPLPAIALSVPLEVQAKAAGNWEAAH